MRANGRAGAAVKDECGATTIEYAIMAALIGAVVVGTVWAIGQLTLGMFEPLVRAFW